MTMKSEFLLPYYTAQNGSGMGMFNTAMGKLQRQLHKGEYDIFKYAPIFESDFIQITKRGEVIDVHNRVRMVTVGIACTSPILPLPDVMLLARPAPGSEDLAGRGRTTKGKNRKAVKTLELTRLLPLKFVRISIHNHEKQQLRLKFATGRSCYLQLCPPLDSGEDLFAYWEKLIYLLRPPVDSHSSTYAIPAEDIMCMPLLNEDQRKEDPEQVSIRSLQLVSNANAITSAVYIGGEGIPHDTQKPSSMPCVPTPQTKATELSKESATGATAEVVATGGVAGTLSVMADRSADSGQVNAAIAGGAATGSGGSRSHMVFAGTGRMSPNSMKIALAGATGNSKEYASHVSTTLSTEDSIDVAIARVGLPNKSVGVTDPLATPLKSTLPSGSFLGGQAEQQRDSQASVESHKEKRERRERREKDRAVGRRGEGRHKRGGEKIVRKSSSHRAARDDKKERGSPRGNRHSSSHKGVGHIPIAKDSRSSHRWGRSVSTTNSSSTSKRHGRISSFLRSIRANFTAKGLASQRGRDMDIMTQTVERTNMEAIMERGESGQSLDIIGSVTSEVTETMTIETH